jgi:hypothetical protein
VRPEDHRILLELLQLPALGVDRVVVAVDRLRRDGEAQLALARLLDRVGDSSPPALRALRRVSRVMTLRLMALTS